MYWCCHSFRSYHSLYHFFPHIPIFPLIFPHFRSHILSYHRIPFQSNPTVHFFRNNAHSPRHAAFLYIFLIENAKCCGRGATGQYKSWKEKGEKNSIIFYILCKMVFVPNCPPLSVNFCKKEEGWIMGRRRKEEGEIIHLPLFLFYSSKFPGRLKIFIKHPYKHPCTESFVILNHSRHLIHVFQQKTEQKQSSEDNRTGKNNIFSFFNSILCFRPNGTFCCLAPAVRILLRSTM